MAKEKLFSFQKLNKYFLLPFFVPIVCFSTKLFSETMKTDDDRINIKDVTEDNTHTFVFLYQIIQSICFILGGLFYFVEMQYSKIKKPENNEANKEVSESEDTDNEVPEANRSSNKKSLKSSSENDTSNEYTPGNNDESNELNESNETNEKNEKISKVNNSKCKSIIIIIFIPLLWIGYNLTIAYGVGYPQLEKRIYFLFFFTLINIYIFKRQIYRHQKLALILTLIGAIPLFTAFGLYFDSNKYNIIYDIGLFIGSFFYSLFLASIKYLTLNKSYSAFLLLLYQGILAFIYTLIIFSIISLTRKGDFTYITNIFHCDEYNYICISYYYKNIIGYIILDTVLQILIFWVVYFFSPELYAISDIFSPLFSLIVSCIKGREKYWLRIFLISFGYLIMIIGAFIYNEMLVCNFCRLNENTWKAIDKKATDESYGIDKNYWIMKEDNDGVSNLEMQSNLSYY